MNPFNNPDALLQMMLANNPQFKKFYEENKNRPPAEIAKQYGINFEEIAKFLK